MFLSASEAEPLDLGSQALAWELVKTRFLCPMRKSYRELPADLRHCAAVISLSSSRIPLLEINLRFNL